MRIKIDEMEITVSDLALTKKIEASAKKAAYATIDKVVSGVVSEVNTRIREEIITKVEETAKNSIYRISAGDFLPSKSRLERMVELAVAEKTTALVMHELQKTVFDYVHEKMHVSRSIPGMIEELAKEIVKAEINRRLYVRGGTLDTRIDRAITTASLTESSLEDSHTASTSSGLGAR